MPTSRVKLGVGGPYAIYDMFDVGPYVPSQFGVGHYAHYGPYAVTTGHTMSLLYVIYAVYA